MCDALNIVLKFTAREYCTAPVLRDCSECSLIVDWGLAWAWESHCP